MKKLFLYFLKGLLFTVPLGVTVYVVYRVFGFIDGLLPIKTPGLGFVVTIIIITLIGVLSSFIFTKSLMSLIDRMFKQLPFIKLLYSALKDLMGALAGEKKVFNKPVMVTLLPQSNAKVFGFITGEDLSNFGLKDYVSVFLPQAYNISGNLIMIPKAQVTPLDKDGSEVMAFIISAGVTGSENSKHPTVKLELDK
jgi:uncharacterized membrane protein